MEQYIKLNNGYVIPSIGFGTWKTVEDNTETVIKRAIDVGYRYFDTASFYGTEPYVGKAIKESRRNREEFYIASKLWKDQMGYEGTIKAFAGSLEQLGVDYLDVYLIHWPLPTPDMPEKEWKQLNIETWKAMEELYEKGRIRAIGVSNFLPHHLENLLTTCKIKPAINQLELHPGYMQDVAVRYCKKYNISMQAWSPLGRSAVLREPLLIKLAAKYKVTTAQICLKFLQEKGILLIPKASDTDRMKENLHIAPFSLSQEDIYRIDTLPQFGWSGEHPDYERVLIMKKNNKDEGEE